MRAIFFCVCILYRYLLISFIILRFWKKLLRRIELTHLYVKDCKNVLKIDWAQPSRFLTSFGIYNSCSASASIGSQFGYHVRADHICQTHKFRFYSWDCQSPRISFSILFICLSPSFCSIWAQCWKPSRMLLIFRGCKTSVRCPYSQFGGLKHGKRLLLEI